MRSTGRGFLLDEGARADGLVAIQQGPLHKQASKYLSFHFALPLSFTDAAGVQRPTPLQPGAYRVDDYIVVERSCRSLPFGFTNSPFTFTKVIKVSSFTSHSKS